MVRVFILFQAKRFLEELERNGRSAAGGSTLQAAKAAKSALACIARAGWGRLRRRLHALQATQTHPFQKVE